MAGGYHSFAISTQGALFSWGWASYGILGLPEGGDRATPQKVDVQEWREEGGTRAVQLACGGLHNLLLRENGEIWGWGRNAGGCLGLGGEEEKRLPTKLPKFMVEGEEVVGIGCGNDHSWVIGNFGNLYIWGAGEFGSHGQGTEDDVKTPKKLENFKVRLPRKANAAQEWMTVFKWLWMGRADEKSVISRLPVEVFFHFVCIVFK
jgi:alpha-tubulin suppressor-like RCC1 family protein